MATNSEGRPVHEGAESGAGTIYCGVRFTGVHACPCGQCDGRCGPTNGCACPSCRRMLAEILVTANMRCPAGHPLVRMLVKDLCVQEHARGYVDGFRCDRCSRVCDRVWEATMHCSTCKFDLCSTCTWAAIPAELKGNIPPLSATVVPSAPPMPTGVAGDQQISGGIPTVPVPLGIQGITVAPRLKCSSGHVLETVTVAELRQRSSGYANGFVCDSCRRSWQERHGALDERVMHCDVCQYDLCAECQARLSAPAVPPPPPPAAIAFMGGAPPGRATAPATATALRCRNGHPLEAVTVAELQRRDSDYMGGYGCDLCNSSWEERHASLQEVVMHCQQCSYDVCPSCAAHASLVAAGAAPPLPEAIGVPQMPMGGPQMPMPMPMPMGGAQPQRNVFGGMQATTVQAGPTPDTDCSKCRTAKVTTMFVPCKHLVCCKACAAQLDRCPVCQQFIVSRVKVFH